MSLIPVDVLVIILLSLPAKSLLRFKSVCKLWYQIINGPDFIKRHVEQSNKHMILMTPVMYMSDFDTFDNCTNLNYPFKNWEDGGLYVVESCHGLLCFCISYYPYTIFLYNPTTQTHKVLPFLPEMSTFYYPKGDKYLGFGYDHVSDDYKCVKIFQRSADESGRFKSQVMVYSLKDDCWKRGAHDVPYYFYCHFGYSVTLNGVVHWSVEGDHRAPLPIVGFNLCDESFSSLPLPEFETEIYKRAHLGVVDSCLCLMLNDWYLCDVWIMKEYGVTSSWTWLCSVVKRVSYEDMRPLSFSISEKKLFVIHTFVHFASVDLETLEITNEEPSGFRKLWSAHVCLENLLMFKDSEDASVGTQYRNRNSKTRKKLMRKTERVLQMNATRIRAILSSNNVLS